MKGFARVTKLTNVGGRADYITNPDKQENIVAKSREVDWKPYHEFEQSKQKTLVGDSKSIEGREVILALSNKWKDLREYDLSLRAKELAEAVAGKATDLQWAVHWNKAHTNLHMHIIFSERQKEKSKGTWDRDIYLTSEGKVARKAADRARDKDGNVLPPVHRKGEAKGGFTAKDSRYTAKSWTADMKLAAQKVMERYGVKFEELAPLHEYHEGKGPRAAAIRAKNEIIRANNASIKEHTEDFPKIKKEALRKRAYNAVKNDKVFLIAKQGDQFLHGEFSLQDWQDEQKLRAVEREAKELYRQTFALKDERHPASQRVLSAPTRFQEDLAKLESVFSEFKAALEERSSCRFFQFRRKRAADARVSDARNSIYEPFKKVIEWGIPQNRIQPEYLAEKDMAYIRAEAQTVSSRLDYEARAEQRTSRPPDVGMGDHKLVKASQERFTALCQEIPEHLKEMARIAVCDVLEQCKSSALADRFARAAVRDIADRYFPAPDTTQRERVSVEEHQQTREKKTKHRGRGR